MNKIFKCIYNHATGTFVAVSELARSNGVKSTSHSSTASTEKSSGVLFKLSAVFATILTALSASTAMADDVMVVNPSGSEKTVVVSGGAGADAVPATAVLNGGIAIGGSAHAATNGSIAIGGGSSAGLADANWAEAIVPATVTVKDKKGTINFVKGQKFKSQEEYQRFLNIDRNGSDYGPNGEAETTYFIRSHQGHMYNVAIGEGAVANGGRNISLGLGAGAPTGDQDNGVFKDKALEKAIKSDNWNTHNVNIGTNAGSNSQKDYSVAIGYEAGKLNEASAKQQRDLYAPKDFGKRSPSVLIGKGAGSNSISYGTIAIGNGAGAGMRLNRNNQESRSNIFLGLNAGAGATTDDGKLYRAPDNGSGLNIGLGNSALQAVNGDGNIGLGLKALRSNTGDNNVGIGNIVAANGGLRNSDRNIMIGTQVANFEGDPVPGGGSTPNANYTKNILIGNFVNTGSGKGIDVSNAIGIGSEVNALGNGSIALGATAFAAQTAKLATAMGPGSKVNSASAQAIGHEANVETGADRAMAIGQGANVKTGAVDAIAQGTSAVAEGESAIAMGNGAKAKGEKSIAIGTGNNVTGAKSGAIGDPNTVSGTGSYSVGNDNTVTADNAFVLGNNVTADVGDSVYLGAKSRVTAGKKVGTKVKNSEGTAGTTTTAGDTGTVSMGSVSIDSPQGSTDWGSNASRGGNVYLDYGNFAGAASHGAVSVGAAGAERRIQNVAAGEISATSTDAINGSQLHSFANNGGTYFRSSNQNIVNSGDPDLVKFGETLTIDGDEHINVGYDAKTNTFHIQGTASTPATIPTYTVNADSGNDIKLNDNSGNDTLGIKGKSGGSIETTANDRDVEIDLKQETKDKIGEIDNKLNKADVHKLTFKANGEDDPNKVEYNPANADNVVNFTGADGTTVALGSDGTYTISSKTLKDGIAKNKTAIEGNTTNITNNAEAIKKGLNFSGDVAEDQTNTFNRKLGAETKVVGGKKDKTALSDNNIGVVSNGTDTLTVKLAKDLTGLTSAVFGDTMINGDGVTINNGPKIVKNGIDAGGKKITNVAEGKAETDAVNVKQLTEAIKGATPNVGKFGVTADSGDAVKKDLDQTIAVQGDGTNIETATVTDTGVKVSLKKDVNLGNDGSVTTGDTVINNTGVTTPKVTAGTTVVENGKVTGLEDRKPGTTDDYGKDPSRAATEGAVKEVAGNVKTNTDNITKLQKGWNVDVGSEGTGQVTSTTNAKAVKAGDTVKVQAGDNMAVKLADQTITLATKDEVTFKKVTIKDGDNSTDLTSTADGLDVGGDKITNVADGSIAEGSKDAVNGGQLHDVKKVADTALQSWDAKVNNEKVKTVDKEHNELEFVNGDNIVITNDSGKVKVSTSKTPTFTSVTVTDGPVINNEGITMNGDTIKNLGSGNVAENSTDGVNGGDVYKAIQGTAQKYKGDNSSVEITRTPKDTLSVLGGATEMTDNNIGTVGDAGGSITVKLAKNLTKLGSVAIENGPTINGGGIDMANKPISKLAAASSDDQAVNLGQLKEEVKKAGNYSFDVQANSADNKTIAATNVVNFVDGDGTTVTKTDQTNGADIKVDLSAKTKADIQEGKDAKTKVDAATFGLEGQSGSPVTKKLNETIKVVGADSNITTKTEGEELKIELAKTLDLGAGGSVTMGDTVINKGGVTITGGPSVTKDGGVNAGDKKVTNVADGTVAPNSKDAVNGGQLNDVKNIAEGKLADFTVGADASAQAAGITVDKDNKRFDIVAGSDAVTTAVDGRTVKVDLSQDSKNGIKDGKDAKSAVDNKGLTFVGNEGESKAKKLGDKVDVKGSSNITTKGVDGGIEIALNNALDLTDAGSVKTGATTINNTGVTTPKVTTGDTYMETGKVMNLEKRKPGDANYGTGDNEGRAATEGAVKAVDDKVTTNTGDISKLKNGWKLKATASNGEVSGDAETPVKAEELVEIDAGKNIKLAQATRKITVATKDVVEFTSATFGTGTDKTVINKDGMTITEGDKTVSLTDDGLNNGGNKITNVAKGTEGTDAVNKSQLDEAVAGAKGKPTSVKAGDTNVSVEKSTTANAEGGAEYVVKLADKVALGAGDNKVTVDGTNGTVTVGGDNGTKVAKGSVTGLDDRKPGTTADYGNDPTRAATEGAVKAVDDKVNTNVTNIANNTEALNKGLDFSGDVAQEQTNKFNRKLGEETKVVGGQTDKEKLSDNNIGVVSNGTDTLTVKLAKELSKLTSAEFVATDGSTTEITGSAITSTNADGDKIAVRTPTQTGFIGGTNGDVTLSNNGLDNGNNKIVNVAEGDKDTDAVNVSQLKPVKEAVKKGLNFEGDYDTDGQQTKNAFKRELGEAVSVTGGADHDDLSEKNIGVVSDGAGGLAVKLAKNIDLTDGGSVAMGDTLVNKDGVTITGGPSITKTNGVDAGNKVIKNVAPGVKGTDAVNKDQLDKAITDSAYSFTVSDGDATTKVGVASGKDVNFKGADGVTVTRTGDANEDQVFTVGLGNDVKIGKDGEPGKMGINGADGQPAIALDGKDGSIGLKGKDGANGTLTVAKGADGLDGTNGQNGKDRLKVNGEDVATMNDGLKFTGNDTAQVVAKKLNQTLQVKGGMTDNATDKVTGANTRVDVEDGALVVKLAKDLTDLNSVTAGTGDKEVKVDGTNGNITVGGEQGTKIEKGKITGLEARDTSSDQYGEGDNANRAATESAVKGVNDKVTTNTNNITELKKGWNVTTSASDGEVSGTTKANVQPDNTVTVDAGKNIKVTQDDKKISIATKDDVEFKSINLKDGNNETKLTTTANGLDVGGDKIGNVASGLDGKSLKDLATGAPELTNAANIGDLQSAVNDIKGTENGGFGLTDDNGKAVKQELGQQIQIKGKDGVTVTAGTESDPNAKVLEVALNGDVKVGGKDGKPGSIGVKGENGKDGTTITKDAVVFNGVDGKDGADGKVSVQVEKGKPALDGKDGQNGADGQTRIVYTKPNGTKEEVATLNDGLKFQGNKGDVISKKLNETLAIKGALADDKDASAANIRVDNDGGELIVKLAKELQDLDKVVVGGENGKAGKDGVDGKPGVALNGKDGSIGLTGKAGADGVTPKADITLENGQPGVNGADGTHMTRIVYEDKDGKHEVATMDDGLKYKGDLNTTAAVKLNKLTELTGNIEDGKTKDDFTDKNIAVVAEQVGDNLKHAKLTLKLAKDLTGLTSVTTTDADGNTTVQNGNGVTITPKAPKDGQSAVSLTKDGLNNGGNQITNVKSGLPENTKLADASGDTLTNAANIGDLKNATTGLIDTGWKLQTNDGTAETVKLGNTVQVVDGVNTKVSKVTTDGDKHTYHVDVTGLPVAYTDADGNPLVKVGDKFYKPSEINPATGLPRADAIESTPAGTTLVSNEGKGGKDNAQTLDGVKSAIGDVANGKDYAKQLADAAETSPNKAVNVKDLKNATDGVTSAIVAKGLEFAGNTGNFHRDLGQTVTIKGEGTLDDNKYSGENIKTIADNEGNITIKMAKDLKVDNVDVKDNVIVGPKGEDGTPGEGAVVIGKNGKDGKDGANGISIKGKDGKDAVAINGKDGVGTIGLNGKDGANADITTDKGDAFLGGKGDDGKDGKDGTRITYQPKDKDGKPVGEPKQVATLDDGLAYTGDVGAANVKLNKITNITGGVADKDKLSDNNIGVVAEQKGENADLTIKLAKNLSGLDNVVFGNAKDDGTAKDPKNTVSIGKDGVNAGGKTITNVASAIDPKGDSKNFAKDLADAAKDPTKGNSAVNVKDLHSAVSNVTDSTKGGGFGLKGQDGKEIKQDLGTTVEVVGNGGVITKVIDVKADPEDPKSKDHQALEISLDNELSVGGKDGKDGAVGVKGADGTTTVAINGKDGGSIVVGGKDGKIGVDGKDGAPGIALNGKDGSIGVAGKDGANADITTNKGPAFLGGKGDDGKDGKNGTRITYQPKNEKGEPVGDPKQVATMDDGIAYKGDTGEANVKLNKLTSIVGGVKEADKLADGNIGVVAAQDGDNAKLTVKLAKDLKGLDKVTFGPVDKDGKPTEKDPKKVVSVGKDGINAGSKVITNVADGDISPTSKDAVNGSQLHKVQEIAENAGSWDISVNGEDKTTVKPKSTVDFGSADGSIGVRKSVENGVTKVDLALGNDVNIGGPGKDGKDGADGKLAVNGKDGKTGVAIDGANGTVGLTGPAGKDGKNPNAVIGVKDGAPGLDGNDGKDGASKTRVVYTKPDGKVEEVATLNDGVKYEGDQGKAAVKLNQTTKVVGGAKGELTDGNIGVVASQDGKNAKLTVKLAKDLKGLNSVEAKDVTVKKGGNLKVENGANVDMGGNQVKNIASGISGKSYRNPKDNNAANIGDVKAIANQAVAPLNKRINDVDKHASAGTASAMAAAGLPQAYLPGHSMVAVGAGTHRGQNAIAVGVSRISDSGHVVIKLNGATNSKGDTSGSVGVGYQW
ncbi:hypothetical protein HPC38_10035 [Pasteurellaceae bacterium HPA106]|uniref:YadA-like family protein n=1 Tax=Spirabiliibacterium pneumoniae TaxID=221400 RepID=UPI001AACD9E1|nr:YadA-like family protein [Spirabiliibacterium pneumoniae]MBE2897204.1 hypothetical protein [Spirabiliibacterium pneumoniae]